MSQSEQPDPRENNQDSHSPEQVRGKRYIMRQKTVSIGNDYWVENEQAEKVYEIDGKIGVSKNFVFEDAHGKKLAKIRKVLLTVRETMEIEGPDGEILAMVKKALFTPLMEHFVVNMNHGPDLEIHGNILDHEYTIVEGRNQVAKVSKKLFNLRDSYSISIEPGQDDVIILSVVVCIDEMTHSGK